MQTQEQCKHAVPDKHAVRIVFAPALTRHVEAVQFVLANTQFVEPNPPVTVAIQGEKEKTSI